MPKTCGYTLLMTHMHVCTPSRARQESWHLRESFFFFKQGWTLDDSNEIRGGAVMNFPSNRHYSLYSINTLGSDRLGRLRNCSRRPSRESFVTWENWGSFFSSQSPKFILRSVLKFQGQFHSSPCMEGPLGPLSPTPKSPFLPLILPSNYPLQTSRPASFSE